MATVNLTNAGTPVGHMNPARGPMPYYVEVEITGAAAAAAKGSALANADVIQCLDIPADTIIMAAGIEITTADTDGSADILMDLGIGGSVDIFVDGGDPSSAGYLAAGTNGATGFGNGVRVAADDTLDIVLGQASAFSSNDDWVARVYVWLCDVDARPASTSA